MEGEKAEFSCSVSKDTYEVKWFRGDQELQEDEKFTIISEGKRRLLIVNDCKLTDMGGFIAHIGTVKASADLSVIGECHFVVCSFFFFFLQIFDQFELL